MMRWIFRIIIVLALGATVYAASAWYRDRSDKPLGFRTTPVKRADIASTISATSSATSGGNATRTSPSAPRPSPSARRYIPRGIPTGTSPSGCTRTSRRRPWRTPGAGSSTGTALVTPPC